MHAAQEVGDVVAMVVVELRDRDGVGAAAEGVDGAAQVPTAAHGIRLGEPRVDGPALQRVEEPEVEVGAVAGGPEVNDLLDEVSHADRLEGLARRGGLDDRAQDDGVERREGAGDGHRIVGHRFARDRIASDRIPSDRIPSGRIPNDRIPCRRILGRGDARPVRDRVAAGGPGRPRALTRRRARPGPSAASVRGRSARRGWARRRGAAGVRAPPRGSRRGGPRWARRGAPCSRASARAPARRRWDGGGRARRRPWRQGGGG